jgi:hypothetical protein
MDGAGQAAELEVHELLGRDRATEALRGDPREIRWPDLALILDDSFQEIDEIGRHKVDVAV